MKRRRVKKVLTLLITAAFLIVTAPAFGKESVKDSKKLADVKKKLGEERHKVRKILRKESSILFSINDLNKKIIKSGKEHAELKKSKKKLEKQIRRASRRVRTLEKETGALRGDIVQRLRAIYKMRSGEILNMAFAPGAQGPIDMARRHKYMTVITDYDSAMLSDYEKKLKAGRDEKKRLVALKKNLEKATTKLVAKNKEQKRLKGDKVALLGEVRREKDKGLKVLKELEEAAKELSGIITKLEREAGQSYSGFGAMKGRLIMPVSGVITSRYGKVMHPKFKTITFNKGIIISAPLGKSVKSVYGGRVIYTGWLKGYGQLVILDHGGGFYTLFAYLDKVLKSRGERVEIGETVALVGDTGPYSESGLYFEIRKKGVPQDPVKWLASR
ncbi:MAG: murein hydrolase activator EnvC family protein [Thermodesulfobacteriota bacterium]